MGINASGGGSDFRKPRMAQSIKQSPLAFGVKAMTILNIIYNFFNIYTPV